MAWWRARRGELVLAEERRTLGQLTHGQELLVAIRVTRREVDFRSRRVLHVAEIKRR